MLAIVSADALHLVPLYHLTWPPPKWLRWMRAWYTPRVTLHSLMSLLASRVHAITTMPLSRLTVVLTALRCHSFWGGGGGGVGWGRGVCLLVGCLTSQQHGSLSQVRNCSNNFTCCHTETEVADQTFHLTQSQYTDTGKTRPRNDPITPGAWQGSHWSASF